jgi:hypothetical protein
MPKQSAAEKRAERETKVRSYWESFKDRLAAAQAYAEVAALRDEWPPVDAPGREFHSNLDHFLKHLSPPGNASQVERDLYLAWARRFAKIKPELAEELPNIERRFAQAMPAPRQSP